MGLMLLTAIAFHPRVPHKHKKEKDPKDFPLQLFIQELKKPERIEVWNEGLNGLHMLLLGETEFEVSTVVQFMWL